jgi:hypothetical protein
VRSDSFDMQNVQRLAELSSKRETTHVFPLPLIVGHCTWYSVQEKNAVGREGMKLFCSEFCYSPFQKLWSN